jgi:hypothetical protein
VSTTKSDHQEEAQAQRRTDIEVDRKEERCGEQGFCQKKKMTDRNATDQTAESSGNGAGSGEYRGKNQSRWFMRKGKQVSGKGKN